MDQRHHTGLWLFAFLTFVVGDSLTTAAGLRGGARETNPIGAMVIDQAGLVGMLAVKTGVLLVLYGLYYAFDRATPYDVDDEAALFVAGLGVLVTAWNLYVISGL